ncbi:MAG: ABC transporter ATP-binding protein [Natronosporangium sp.]
MVRGGGRAVTALLSAEGLHVTFRVNGLPLVAVDGLSLDVHRGETVALVGESGSGKSTVALTVMGAHRPDAGRITFDGTEIGRLPERALVPVRRRMQMVFQDPYASLDPRMTVGRIVAEPLRVHRIGRRGAVAGRVAELLDAVGLARELAGRLPAQLSGGQRQRVAIARALALEPELLIADEPVSALDVSIQAQIVNLLRELQRERTMGYLLISHDLALVHHLADRVVVMYLGAVVESGGAEELVSSPLHPYTAALLSATPVADADAVRRERIVLRGEPPSAIHRPAGCAFHPRCPIADERCAVEPPPLTHRPDGRAVRCFYPGMV